MQTVWGVDAHAHVFHRGLKLSETRRYTPSRDAPLSAYLALLDRLGFTNGVLVQPSFLGVDNRFLLECVGQSGGRLRGIAVVSRDMGRDQLQSLAAQGVAGVRLNLIGRDLPDFQARAWQTHFQHLIRAGLHVEVQCRGEEVATVVRPLLEELPCVVLDHFGLPGRRDVSDPAIQAILALGATQRLYLKVSAPYRAFLSGSDLATLFPAYLAAFGPTRMLWGSDWPHTQFEARANAEDALSELEHSLAATPSVYAQIVDQTARWLYGFGEHAEPGQ